MNSSPKPTEPDSTTPCLPFEELQSAQNLHKTAGDLLSPQNVPNTFTDQSTMPTKSPTVPYLVNTYSQGSTYQAVNHHWFFKKVVDGNFVWNPFSASDSFALEEAFTSATISSDTKVATEGGRYDVEVLKRRQLPVYWNEEPREVRRCSWFVKGSMEMRYIPYEENVAIMLEEVYRQASTTNQWNRQIPLPNGEMIVIHSPSAIAHYSRSMSPDVWGNSPQMQHKPQVVKRGVEEFDIADGEPDKIDHLLFLVHGIGQFCDLKFRPVTEVVDDFRSVSLQLIQSHFKDAVMDRRVGRVEVLPVSWHQALHNEHIDTKLKNITLQSIPKLRHFTNDTLLDILFYTSPVFCETIVQAVGNELNRLYNLFLTRNPTFPGEVFLGGHSLGSLILFDMLCNQSCENSPGLRNPLPTPPQKGQKISEDEDLKLSDLKTARVPLSRTVSYVTIGSKGTGQPFICYPQLAFKPRIFFALGSPIGMFITVRGIDTLGEDFALPTCPGFFNIFHPFDPVAYRVESLINTDFSKYSPLLIPHHKGRKRMHLELKDTLEHVGSALKEKLVESVRSTWNTVYQLALFQRSDTQQAILDQVNEVIENETTQSSAQGPSCSQTSDQNLDSDIKIGKLNGGRRIDYVLQEAPLESFNEYLFALSSHVCYWESEDTMLMMLKEIYGSMGISPDTQVAQQILPFEQLSGSLSDNYNTGAPSLS